MGSQGLHQMQYAQAPKSLDKINHGNVLAGFQILPAADFDAPRRTTSESGIRASLRIRSRLSPTAFRIAVSDNS